MGQLTDAGNTTTLSHYLNLLDTAGLLGGIEKYAKDIIRKRSSRPKFQVHNTALISAQRADLFEEVVAQPDQWAGWLNHPLGLTYSIILLRKDFHCITGEKETMKWIL